jgi:hypothetical protein
MVGRGLDGRSLNLLKTDVSLGFSYTFVTLYTASYPRQLTFIDSRENHTTQTFDRFR